MFSDWVLFARHTRHMRQRASIYVSLYVSLYVSVYVSLYVSLYVSYLRATRVICDREHPIRQRSSDTTGDPERILSYRKKKSFFLVPLSFFFELYLCYRFSDAAYTGFRSVFFLDTISERSWHNRMCSLTIECVLLVSSLSSFLIHSLRSFWYPVRDLTSFWYPVRDLT